MIPTDFHRKIDRQGIGALRDARSNTRSRGQMSRGSVGTWIALLFGAYLVLLALAHFLPVPTWLRSAEGLAVNELGPLGDSFAPLTSIFAALAAVGAWRSFETQRELLEDERRRNSIQRSDDIFFRFIGWYEEDLRREETRYHETIEGKPFYKPWSVREAVESFSADEALQASNASEWHELLYGDDFFFGALVPVEKQACAIVRWMKDSASSSSDVYGEVIGARLTRGQRCFWQLAIAATSDADLIRFANSIGLYKDAATESVVSWIQDGITVEEALIFGGITTFDSDVASRSES